MYYTYIIESEIRPAEYYRGHTKDLRTRLKEHNAGKCDHTRKFRPWRIKFYAAFESELLAISFEKYLKSGSGHAFAIRHIFTSARSAAQDEA